MSTRQKKILFFVMTVLVSALPLGHAEQAAAPAAGAVVDAGNQICPVSGDKVNPEVSYVHEGIKYSFCCKACIKKFKKDPKKYISVMEKGAAHEHAGHEHGAHEHGGHDHA